MYRVTTRALDQGGAEPRLAVSVSHLCIAQLPRNLQQYTQQAAKLAARKTSTQNFRIFYWHSKPPDPHAGRHQHKIFAFSIGTAAPNTIYTQQTAKPACQEDINTKFSHLLLAATRAQFTHSKPPNPHARKTRREIFLPFATITRRNLQENQYKRPGLTPWFLTPVLGAKTPILWRYLILWNVAGLQVQSPDLSLPPAAFSPRAYGFEPGHQERNVKSQLYNGRCTGKPD